ncbi:hypothetical protein [Flavobacterium sp.]|uniref:hypothetical protein n=1 Tax=Flavobacterium sp. TaxID=239 RepID=UPI00378519BB
MNRILLYISSSFLLVNLLVFLIALINIKLILNIDWLFTYDFIFFPLFIYSILILIKSDKLRLNNVDLKWTKGFALIIMIIALILFFTEFFNEKVFFKENEYFMIIEKTKSIKISTELFFSHYKIKILSESSLNIWFSYVSSIVTFLKHKNEK